jgi:hypothetical protein
MGLRRGSGDGNRGWRQLGPGFVLPAASRIGLGLPAPQTFVTSLAPTIFVIQVGAAVLLALGPLPAVLFEPLRRIAFLFGLLLAQERHPLGLGDVGHRDLVDQAEARPLQVVRLGKPHPQHHRHALRKTLEYIWSSPLL